MNDLIRTLKSLCEWGAVRGDDCSPGFRQIIKRTDWSRPRNRPAAAAHLPVVEEWLDAAVAHAGPDPLGNLARAMLAERRSLPWFSMYGDHADDPVVDRLRAGYAVLRISGPGAEWYSEDLTTAITLQAPHVLYPPRAHKQCEIYGVISGQADWQRGAEIWTRRRSGEVFYHPSGIRHATQTHEEPLLAFAAWLNDVHLKPVFVSG